MKFDITTNSQYNFIIKEYIFNKYTSLNIIILYINFIIKSNFIKILVPNKLFFTYIYRGDYMYKTTTGDTLIFVLKLHINDQIVYLDTKKQDICLVLEKEDMTESKKVFTTIRNGQQIYGKILINIEREITQKLQGLYKFRFFLRDLIENTDVPLTGDNFIFFQRGVTS